MSRTIERHVARKLYDNFSRTWRREKRMADAYGKPGRKPTFNEWYHMHSRDNALMAESTPSDVQEYLGLDPWEVRSVGRVTEEAAEQRGVLTIPIAGNEDSE